MNKVPILMRRARGHASRLMAVGDAGNDPVAPRMIDSLVGLLEDLGKELAQPGVKDSEAVRKALPAYAEELEELRTHLGTLEQDLGRRRTEIESRKRHLSAARLWTESYRRTI